MNSSAAGAGRSSRFTRSSRRSRSSPRERANYALGWRSRPEERLAFERDVLFPLAGLDPGLAGPYARVRELLEELSYAGNEAGRRSRRCHRCCCRGGLARALHARLPERAQQGVRFFDTYRSYVINYNLGQDLVQRHVEARAAAAGSDPATLAQRKWRAFVELISSPRLPSGLEGAGSP